MEPFQLGNDGLCPPVYDAFRPRVELILKKRLGCKPLIERPLGLLANGGFQLVLLGLLLGGERGNPAHAIEGF